MKQKELLELTDAELLGKAKKMKSSRMMHAVLIGFLVGIIIYSIWVNSVGLFTLIPLFFIYKMLNGSKDKKDNQELDKLLKERNLK